MQTQRLSLVATIRPKVNIAFGNLARTGFKYYFCDLNFTLTNPNFEFTTSNVTFTNPNVAFRNPNVAFANLNIAFET